MGALWQENSRIRPHPQWFTLRRSFKISSNNSQSSDNLIVHLSKLCNLPLKKLLQSRQTLFIRHIHTHSQVQTNRLEVLALCPSLPQPCPALLRSNTARKKPSDTRRGKTPSRDNSSTPASPRTCHHSLILAQRQYLHAPWLCD